MENKIVKLNFNNGSRHLIQSCKIRRSSNVISVFKETGVKINFKYK